jgi:hypothetical protein
MSDTPLLALPYLAAAQAQKHVTHNEALTLLDGLVQAGVKSRGVATPPPSPAAGDRYLVAAAATDAWAGKEGQIAALMDGGWRFLTPREGWRLWVDDEDQLLVFTGSLWQETGTTPDILQDLSLLGVNSTADATNKLTVASAASLFNNVGAGHQVKINKAAGSDTASLLFQTGYSGRAEMGTTGDDDFHIKVSADGTTFHEALTAHGATGKLTAHTAVSFSPQTSDPASPQDGDLWYNSTSNTFRKRQNGVSSDLAAASGGAADDDIVSGAAALDVLPPALRGRQCLALEFAAGSYVVANDGAAADVGAISAYPSVTLSNATGGTRTTRKRLLESVAADSLRLVHEATGKPLGALFEAAHTYSHSYSQPTVAQLSVSNVVDSSAPDGWSGNWVEFGDNSLARYARSINSEGPYAIGDDVYVSAMIRMTDGAAPVPGQTTGTGDFLFTWTGATVKKPSDGSPGCDVEGPFAGGVYRVSTFATMTTAASQRPIFLNKYTSQSARSFKLGPVSAGVGRYPPSLMPATGTTPSRAADVLSLPVSGFATDELTVAGVFTAPWPSPATRTLARLVNGSDVLEVSFASGSSAPVIKLTVGGTDQFNATAAALVPGTACRFFAAVSKADKQLRWKFSGLAAGASAALVTPPLSFAPVTLDVGHAGGAGQLGAAIQSLAVLDHAWTAADGQTFTDGDYAAQLHSHDDLRAIVSYATDAGRHYCNSDNTTTLTTLVGGAGRMDVAPWVCPLAFTADQVGVNCTTAVASAQGKIVCYDSDSNGRPSALLFETGTLDFSSTGYKSVAQAFVFEKGRTYWLGIRHSSTATLSGHQMYCSPVLSFPATPSTAPNKLLRRTLAFATAAPAAWGWLASEEVSAVVTAVFLRKA